MGDIIQEIVEKLDCMTPEKVAIVNRKATLAELDQLKRIYKDDFRVNDADELSGEFVVDLVRKYTITLTGPSMRRNLRYKDIATYDNENLTTTYLLSSLPPVSMGFQLDGRYPRDPNFAFWIDSPWLPSASRDIVAEAISRIIAMSDYNSQPLTQCCYYLSHNAMEALFSLGDPEILVINTRDLFTTPQERCEFVEMLVDFEEVMRDQEFELSQHLCPICFDEQPGILCSRLRACNHVFCNECLSRAISEHVESGANSGSPLCPSCNLEIHPVEIRRVLSAEMYERYERLLLNRTLSSMSDVVECPQRTCGNPHVILHPDLSNGICAKCHFHFCARCRRAFHPDTACQNGPLSNLSPAEARDLVERYDNAGAEGKSMLEKQYGRLNLVKLKEDVASNTYIERQCKICPSCKSPIEKTDGCNRMRCHKCSANFCWKCLKVIESTNPYDHFSSKRCALWT